MIRVLQVLFSMNCGGAENMVMNLYRGIDRTKVQFDFVLHTDKKSFFHDEILSLGGRIYSAPEYKVLNHLEYKKWWNDFFVEHKEYKVIHGHMYSIAPIYLNAARKNGLTTIIHSHSTSEEKGFKEIIKAILRKKAKNSADFLFACSDKAGKWLYGEDVCRKDNYFLLKNAILSEAYVYNENVREEVRKDLGVEDNFVIGHVGRFSLPKNHKYLLEVFHEVIKEKPKSVLLLVGAGTMENEIVNKIKELGLEKNVIMTGIRKDIGRVMQAMDCFVFPSIYEGLPVSVVEAQASGLPCFISDSITEEVCITDLVQMLSINDSPKVWRDAIIKTKDSFIRTNRKEEIEKAGYDISKTAQNLQNFYIEHSR